MASPVILDKDTICATCGAAIPAGIACMRYGSNDHPVHYGIGCHAKPSMAERRRNRETGGQGQSTTAARPAAGSPDLYLVDGVGSSYVKQANGAFTLVPVNVMVPNAAGDGWTLAVGPMRVGADMAPPVPPVPGRTAAATAAGAAAVVAAVAGPPPVPPVPPTAAPVPPLAAAAFPHVTEPPKGSRK